MKQKKSLWTDLHQHRDRAELEWALGQVELRKQWQSRSDLWYRLEKRIRAVIGPLLFFLQLAWHVGGTVLLVRIWRKVRHLPG